MSDQANYVVRSLSRPPEPDTSQDEAMIRRRMSWLATELRDVAQATAPWGRFHAQDNPEAEAIDALEQLLHAFKQSRRLRCCPRTRIIW